MKANDDQLLEDQQAALGINFDEFELIVPPRGNVGLYSHGCTNVYFNAVENTLYTLDGAVYGRKK